MDLQGRSENSTIAKLVKRKNKFSIFLVLRGGVWFFAPHLLFVSGWSEPLSHTPKTIPIMFWPLNPRWSFFYLSLVLVLLSNTGKKRDGRFIDCIIHTHRPITGVEGGRGDTRDVMDDVESVRREWWTEPISWMGLLFSFITLDKGEITTRGVGSWVRFFFSWWKEKRSNEKSRENRWITTRREIPKTFVTITLILVFEKDFCFGIITFCGAGRYTKQGLVLARPTP